MQVLSIGMRLLGLNLLVAVHLYIAKCRHWDQWDGSPKLGLESLSWPMATVNNRLNTMEFSISEILLSQQCGVSYVNQRAGELC